MKVRYTTNNRRLSVELEADNQKGLWAELAAFQDTFEESKCLKCNGEDLKFVVRKATDSDGEEYDYHELRCNKCGAKLAFGQSKKGGKLFPKRKNKAGEVLGKYGWVKWNPETEMEE